MVSANSVFLKEEAFKKEFVDTVAKVTGSCAEGARCAWGPGGCSVSGVGQGPGARVFQTSRRPRGVSFILFFLAARLT